jgi:S-DNA-T family DNA segregation ATPase FtsK/SpoIIIE
MTKRTRTSSRRKTSRSRSTRGTSQRRQRRQPKPKEPWLDLSAALRAEIVGIAFLAMAILTFLSLLSPNQGKITSGWLHFLRQGFGWGAYLTPLGFGALGLRLLMRGFGRSPSTGWARVLGLLLIFAIAEGLTHLLVSEATPWQVVIEGRGGGLLGWAVGESMRYALGRIGAYVVLAAFGIIGLVLFLGRSTAEIGMVLWSGWGQIKGQWNEWRTRLSEKAAPSRPDYTINGSRTGSGMLTTSRTRPPARTEPLQAREMDQEPELAPEPAPRALSLSTPLRSKPTQPSWKLPDVRKVLEDLSAQEISEAEIETRVEIIERTLESFGVPARVVEVNQGPVITQFGVEPGFITGRGGKQTKVKVSRISSLADDLSLALAAAPIRIEAPVPGRSIVGIEVPNKEVALVSLRGVMETDTFRKLRRKTPLPIALGENVSGEPIVTDLTAMPHLLIAGATGSGKSVCINSIIAGFLCTNTPDNLRMLMIDPKRVELTGYRGIPHLLAPVVVELERVVGTLQWVTREMDRRYKQFAKVGARNIEDFNRRVVSGGQDHIPYIVVIIDELADLMMIAPDEVERLVCRIAQMARATGIHLVIATQRPSVDVVTGLIKANFPARISFMVTSGVDSRVIIDTTGAERLLGSGDMLFMSPSSSQVVRLQGCFVSPGELDRLVSYWRHAAGEPDNAVAAGDQFVQGALPTLQQMQEPQPEPLPGQEDEMIGKAIQVVRKEGRASTTLLQRRLRIGYARASRIIVALEEQGIVGPDMGGSRGREVILPQEGQS